MADEQVILLKDGKAFAAFASAGDAVKAADALGVSGTITSVPLYADGTGPEFSPLYVIQVGITPATGWVDRDFLEPNQEAPAGFLANASRESVSGKTIMATDETLTVTIKGTDIPKVRKLALQIVEQAKDGKYTVVDKLLGTKISFA